MNLKMYLIGRISDNKSLRATDINLIDKASRPVAAIEFALVEASSGKARLAIRLL